ncbi:MAG: DUF2442 domain-containing protein [Gemmatimonadota bacterium]|nr:DUF2442 domain-containing protein [Gemmatimonadota bacterium]
MPGTATSEPEVTNISAHGFWILLDDEELFLSYEEFPWFRGGTVEQISTVAQDRPGHLRWKALDVDLTVDSIRHPDRYPLKAGLSDPS